ncbi:MAG: hypothetical protein JSU63_12600 [Phycisphaerales bacterium]|nr:MAG: hypothetical protein JSU63_12600 [Phycisphaerales bacterium]
MPTRKLLALTIFLSSSLSAAYAQKMYWTDTFRGVIERANLDGTDREVIVAIPESGPRGITLDLDGGKVYWTDSFLDRIQRANLDGTGVQDLITTGLDEPRGIALDLGQGKMYWTDRGTDSIHRANLNGSARENLIVSGLNDPFQIVLDLSGGKMYWADGTPGNRILRANLDGSDVETILSGLVDPVGLGIDFDAGKMYWTEYSGRRIRRANLDGSDIEDVVTTPVYEPLGLFLDPTADIIYWTDTGSNKIQRGKLDGSEVYDLVVVNLDNPREITADLRCPAGGEDCQPNSIPDDCDLIRAFSKDCNANGVPDECDIAEGVSQDCDGNGNGVPDECEPDCNDNGIADSCDIAVTASDDCNVNEVPDECEPDCNDNDITDECDIADATSADCNRNGVPDECDLAGATSHDCNFNNIPDECEDDCNFNGFDDACDLANGTSEDCNDNNIPDECERDCNSNDVADSCDIGSGAADDCNANGVPDECETDCDNNGIADECDRSAGRTLPCGILELVPSGSTGPYEVRGQELVIPQGGVQVEFEFLVSNWGATPGGPVLGGFQGVFLTDSLRGSDTAISSTYGPDLELPVYVQCEEDADCPPSSPPPVTQTDGCGTLGDGLCDDYLAGFMAVRVCLNDMTTPCWTNADCPAGVACVEDPRFVFSDRERILIVVIPGEDYTRTVEWWGVTLYPEEDDGDTRYYAGTLRIIVPESASGSYTLRLNTDPLYAILNASNGVSLPVAVIHGRLTIAGACCFPDGSCMSMGESECADAGGSYAPGGCEGDADGDGVVDACDPCPYDDPDDSDGDGVCDSDDGCPDDPTKIDPGICGCGIDDNVDTDGDSTPDCVDQCPGIDDATFAPCDAEAIPTVSTWGLVIVALLLLIVAKVCLSRPAPMRDQRM